MEITQLGKKAFKAYREKRRDKKFDFECNLKEQKLYQSLIAQDKSRVISRAQEKLIREYSKDVLGSLDFAPGLRSYTAYSREFKEGWIPNNYYGRVVLPSIKGEFCGIDNLKTHSKRLLQTDLIPDLAYCLAGDFILTDGTKVCEKELERILFEVNEFVFLKKNNSMRGSGITKLDREKFKKCDLKSFGDFVIQSGLTQHQFFENIVSGSIATLRVTTVKAKGVLTKNRLSSLRVGRFGDEFIRDTTTLVVGISPNGFLSENALGGNWEMYSAHPDTGYVFKDQKIPFFELAEKVCEDLHDKLGFPGIIGWDICITPNGSVQILEWNAQYPGINYSEAMVGPNFKGLVWENLWK
jgi:hypothetical protein